MYDHQDDYSLCAVFQEVRHLLLQRWLHLVFGDDLQVVPGCFAPSLHLDQIILELVKIHLGGAMQIKIIVRCTSWHLEIVLSIV